MELPTPKQAEMKKERVNEPFDGLFYRNILVVEPLETGNIPFYLCEHIQPEIASHEFRKVPVPHRLCHAVALDNHL